MELSTDPDYKNLLGRISQTYNEGRLRASLSRDLSLRHGKGFSRSNLIRFRQFYLAFPNGATVSHQLSWSEEERMANMPGDSATEAQP